MWSNLTKALRELQRSFGDVGGSYRPDLHYMRGPGPKWCAKHGNLSPREIPTAIMSRAAMVEPRSRSNDKEMYHTRNAMILLAIVGLGTMAATHALAAQSGSNGVHFGGGLQSNRAGGAFQGQVIERVPAMPPPTFNPSTPYTVPQSPEVPVSPASPGSVFGNH
jgi:hypothetical protein